MAFLSLRETLPKTLQIHFFLCRWIFAFLDQIWRKVSYILLYKSRKPLEQPRNCLVRQIWSPMTSSSLRETLPKTLQIDFFPCRRSFEWETRSFQYFSFFIVYILKQSRDYLAMPKTSGAVSQKKSFFYCLVRFALLMSFSQL